LDALRASFGGYGATEIGSILKLRNGFYAFEGALHVFSTDRIAAGPNIFEWNSETLWRFEYKGIADGNVFFAEDIFGNQFCSREGSIWFFDAESGSLKRVGATVEEWAGRVLEDYRFWTGYSLAHDWQAKTGRLPDSQRLVPKKPFITGGEYSVTNLHALDAVKGMRLRGSIAAQLRDLPDGATIRLTITD
jgi:hypothetical protein